MKLLFLDCDGVLNDHTQHENKYCGVKAECVAALNFILGRVPDLQLVITSAWRYPVLSGDMTVKGFQTMLLVLGVNCEGRVHGVTVSDEEAAGGVKDWEYLKEHGCEIRAEQISAYVEECRRQRANIINGVRHVVLDDLALPISEDNFVRTDGSRGLTAEEANRVVQMFGG